MFIYSTCSNDQKFNLFEEKKEKGRVPRIKGFVIVAGKANIANANLETRKGIVTQVTDKQWELLQNNKSFLKMVEDGHMKHDTKKLEAEDVAKADMKAADGSAPVSKEALEADGAKVSTDEEVKA